MALIPPTFINSVVAIGTRKSDGNIAWFASGFLYGHHLYKIDDTQSRFKVYLVTNRHVLAEVQNVILRFNPQEDKPAREFPIDFSGENAAKRLFHPDPAIDLGAVAINANVLRDNGIEFDYFRGNVQIVTLTLAQEIGLFEGDFCYLLGFPMGLIGGHRNYVITRHGTLARISDFLRGHSNEILVDCMNFPGNSGGPVVTKPELLSIQGTKSQNNSYLLGIVSQYITYQDVAVSTQTNRPRVVFEENSGLAKIVPAHYLKEWMDGLPQNQAGPETKPELKQQEIQDSEVQQSAPTDG